MAVRRSCWCAEARKLGTKSCTNPFWQLGFDPPSFVALSVVRGAQQLRDVDQSELSEEDFMPLAR